MAKRKSNLESFKKLLKCKALSEDLVVDIVYQLGRSDALIEELENKIDSEKKIPPVELKSEQKDKLASDDEIWSLLDA